jgi:hypothetical protein
MTKPIKTVVKERMKYSTAETELLELLRAANGKPITTNDLILKRYGKQPERHPFNAASNVRATLKVLIRKVDHNRETFVIKKEGQVGPKAQNIWLEKR